MPDAQTVSPDPLDGVAETLDRATSAGIAQLTSGIAPTTLIQSLADWWLHLLLYLCQ